LSIDTAIRASAAPNASRTTAANSNGPSAGALENAWNIGGALKTAKSAYNNDRFASVLEQLADPRSSLTIALMRAEAGQGTHVGHAQAQYAENS